MDNRKSASEPIEELSMETINETAQQKLNRIKGEELKKTIYDLETSNGLKISVEKKEAGPISETIFKDEKGNIYRFFLRMFFKGKPPMPNHAYLVCHFTFAKNNKTVKIPYQFEKEALKQRLYDIAKICIDAINDKVYEKK